MTLLDTARRTLAPDKDTSTRARSGTGLDQHMARRAAMVIGLFGIVMVHALDLQSKIEELPYAAWLYVGLIISALVLAEGLLRKDDLLLWLACGALAASAMIGYTISRTTGLPGDGGGDKGNWTEPLGLASLVVEGIVILLVVGRLLASRTSPSRT